MTSKDIVIHNASTIVVLLKWNLQNLSKVPFNISNKLAPPKNFDYRIMLLQRSNHLKSFPSFHVFPGGKLDEFDSDPLWKNQKVLKTNSIEDEGLPFKVAALREMLEETNVFLDHNNEIFDRFSVDKIQNLRHKIHNDRTGKELYEFLEKNDITLNLSHLKQWARWVTPIFKGGPFVRFDTRFYIAPLQSYPLDCSVDGTESVILDWLSPEEALEQFQLGNIYLPPPTWMTLNQLSQFKTFDQVIEHSKEREKFNFTYDAKIVQDPLSEVTGIKQQYSVFYGDHELNPNINNNSLKNRLVFHSTTNDLRNSKTWRFYYENTLGTSSLDSIYNNTGCRSILKPNQNIPKSNL
ncbi:hypothetical protein DLAC_00020 [Tieghemostelium lacteum]|uniref:Nudix hydrolase domain-containing protein n=1 Tax=Tieghemostelium lacteum TaxID=361077 RepID=A0A152A8J9_TIELA|nr:hypothetical protein DLAC_00020 [Tieghemostelium lacteum]|eukprot:KYR02580.1 hypothetical protein DLAC_00020 [Tieghemostelium lacteum]